jgi:hypothetical protein
MPVAENDTPKEPTETDDTANPEAEPAASETESPKSQSGPAFTEAPSPLDGVKKSASDAWDRMEVKTVSMRTYVGSIIGVIILMLLARCGG